MSTHHHNPHVSIHLKSGVTRDVVRIAQAVFTGMSTHTELFPAPVPALSVLHTETQALIAAQDAMATRVPSARPIRDAARAAVCLSLHSELRYVQSLVDLSPDRADLLASSAGFSVSGVGVHTKPLIDVKITPASGSVHLSANASALVGKSLKGHLYNWQWSQDAETTWHDAPSTTSAKAILTGLPALANVHFRVRSVVGGVPGPWSHSVSLVVR